MDFGSILRRGQKIFKTTDQRCVWDRCEDCGERMPLFKYEDKEKQIWMLCENCIDFLVKDEI